VARHRRAGIPARQETQKIHAIAALVHAKYHSKIDSNKFAFCSLITLFHTRSDSKSALRRPIQNQFPEYIKNEQGMWLYTKVWPVPSPRAAIVISHGFGEHILRYEHVARFFNANGIMVCGLDHQGHGQSEGTVYMHLQFNARELLFSKFGIFVLQFT
jgi:hypothetical protein